MPIKKKTIERREERKTIVIKLKPLSAPTPILKINSFKEFEKMIDKKPDEDTIKFLSDCKRVHDRHKILV